MIAIYIDKKIDKQNAYLNLFKEQTLYQFLITFKSADIYSSSLSLVLVGEAS